MYGGLSRPEVDVLELALWIASSESANPVQIDSITKIALELIAKAFLRNALPDLRLWSVFCAFIMYPMDFKSLAGSVGGINGLVSVELGHASGSLHEYLDILNLRYDH